MTPNSAVNLLPIIGLFFGLVGTIWFSYSMMGERDDPRRRLTGMAVVLMAVGYGGAAVWFLI